MDKFCYVCGAFDNGIVDGVPIALNWCCDRKDRVIICRSCYSSAVEAQQRQAHSLQDLLNAGRCPGNWKSNHSIENMVKGLQMIVADL